MRVGSFGRQNFFRPPLKSPAPPRFGARLSFKEPAIATKPVLAKLPNPVNQFGHWCYVDRVDSTQVPGAGRLSFRIAGVETPVLTADFGPRYFRSIEPRIPERQLAMLWDFMAPSDLPLKRQIKQIYGLPDRLRGLNAHAGRYVYKNREFARSFDPRKTTFDRQNITKVLRGEYALCQTGSTNVAIKTGAITDHVVLVLHDAENEVGGVLVVNDYLRDDSIRLKVAGLVSELTGPSRVLDKALGLRSERVGSMVRHGDHTHLVPQIIGGRTDSPISYARIALIDHALFEFGVNRPIEYDILGTRPRYLLLDAVNGLFSYEPGKYAPKTPRAKS